jgi:hypothetical protein
LVLIVASLSKAVMPAAVQIPFVQLSQRWIAVVVACLLEALIGAWLLSGLRPFLARLVAAAMFAMFVFVAVARGAHGERSCGCFGTVGISPWGMAGFDVVACGLLAVLCRHRSRHPLACVPIGWKYGAGLGLLAVVLLVAIRHYPSIPAGDDITNVRKGDVIAIDPAHWVGRKLSIASFLVQKMAWGSDKRIAIIARHGCPICDELMSRLREGFSDDLRLSDVLVIWVPTPGGDASGDETLDPRIEVATLDDQYQWFAETPIMLGLTGDVVDWVHRPHTTKEALDLLNGDTRNAGSHVGVALSR